MQQNFLLAKPYDMTLAVKVVLNPQYNQPTKEPCYPMIHLAVRTRSRMS